MVVRKNKKNGYEEMPNETVNHSTRNIDIVNRTLDEENK